MLAEFTINPMQSEHMSKDLAKVVENLESSGLNYRLGPMGTCIEGPLHRVLAVIQHCHQVVAADHPRVITRITIDDRKDHPHHLEDMVTAVERQLKEKEEQRMRQVSK